MKRFDTGSVSFSLIEVVIALGVASFCLIAVFGLLPVGVQTNQNAISQTAAVGIACAVIADMRATPKMASTSAQFGVTFGTARTLYFDNEGGFSISSNGTSRYQLNITFPPNADLPYAATFAELKVSWPARADPAKAMGSTETFAAFDRH